MVRKDGTGDFTTISAAVSAMAGGDTVLVGPGAYNERIKPSGKSGTTSAPTIIKAETQGTVDTWGADTAGCNYLVIQGFNISIPSSLTGWTDGVGVAVRSSNVQVISNYIHDVHYAAVNGTGTSGVIVRGNHAFKCDMGVVISGTGWLVEGNEVERLIKYSEVGDADNMRFFGSNHTIRGNHFYGTSSSETGSAHVDGFQTFDDNGDFAQHIVIENNLLEGFYHQGVFMEATYHSNTYDITVRNNIFIGASTYSVGAVRNMRDVKAYNNTIINPAIFGIRYEQNTSGEAKNNICYSSKTGIPDGDIKELTYSADSTSTVVGNNNLLYIPSKTIAQSSFPNDIVNANPQFANLAGNDFHLLAGSSAIDRGATLAGFNADRDGVTRPQGSAWDIGAYESGNSAPDTTPPQLSAISATGVTTNGAAINWTTSENANGRVDYGTTTSYGSVVSNGLPVLVHAMNLSGLTPNTLYHYRVFSSDVAGNANTSGDFTFTTIAIDMAAPTVTLSAPGNGAVISNSITLSATATDSAGGSGVASVSFLVDGVPVGSDSSSPYSLSWNSATVANGTHTIQARALDAAGNAGSSSVTLTVQNPVLPLTAGLVGYWPFDGASGTTAPDISGNGNTGTLLNGAAWGVGKLAGGLALDGVDDYVRVPSSPALEQVSNAVTVCAWVKIDANGSMQSIARKVISETTNVAPYAAYDLVVTDSSGSFKPRMAVTRTDGTRGVALGATHPYGAWHHLAGVYDGANVRLYVNGVEEANTTFTGALLQTTQPFCIGRYGAVTEAVKGTIDDFRLYNRALSASEVLTLSSSTAAPAPPVNLRLDE